MTRKMKEIRGVTQFHIYSASIAYCRARFKAAAGGSFKDQLPRMISFLLVKTFKNCGKGKVIFFEIRIGLLE